MVSVTLCTLRISTAARPLACALLAFSFSSFTGAVAQMPKPPAPALQAPPPPAAPPTDPNQVVITVGDEKITAAQYDELVSSLPDQYQQFARGQGKRQFAENVIQLKLLSKEAEKRKLDQSAKVQSQLAFQRQNILAQVMFQEFQNTAKVDDAAVQKYYDEHKSDYEGLRARHILIRVAGAPMPAPEGKKELTDEEALAKANAIVKRLAAGEDFAAIAKKESDDTQSGAQGGDLGSFKRGMMVPPFEQAAFALPVGKVSDPVKTPFGYHIIRVDAKENKTLAEVRPEIEKKIRPEIARKEIDTMRSDAKVVLNEGYFGPAQPTLPPGPAK